MARIIFVILLLLNMMILSFAPHIEAQEYGSTINIPITYAPESKVYLPDLIEQFNQQTCSDYINEPVNPVTGEPLETFICIRDLTLDSQGIAQGASSGNVTQQIVDAIIMPPADTTNLPIIFQPSVSHWLTLANFKSGQIVFDINATLPTTRVPVVIAMWETYYNALVTTKNRDVLSWADLVELLNNGNGWQSYGLSEPQIRYGHTNPLISSTALSTLMSEFSASAAFLDKPFAPLTLEVVRDESVLNGVRRIEQLVHHYFPRTTEFVNYIEAGPEYLQFVALEENDLIALNQRLNATNPDMERLVAIYPSEGVFIHEHPMGIVNAPWVSSDQKGYATIFAQFMTQQQAQQTIMSFGFRPIDTSISLDPTIFSVENGVDTNQPTRILPPPAPEVIAEVQASWSLVSKPADVLLVVDISGSMWDDDKMPLVKDAIAQFLDTIDSDIRLGLLAFNGDILPLVPIDDYAISANQIRLLVDGQGSLLERTELVPFGQTALYNAVIAGIDLLRVDQSPNRTRAIILLSDGKNSVEGSTTALSDVIGKIALSSDSSTPVIVIPISYGAVSDLETLEQIAITSSTQAFDATQTIDIGLILRTIAGYF